MACFNDLHKELLGHICRYLEQCDLAALALTARAFNYEAERLLYRDISLCCGPLELTRTLGSLFVEGRPRYKRVRSLSVVLDGRPRQVLVDAINHIKNAAFLSLHCMSSTPCEGVKSLPRKLRSLHIGWNFFDREQLFELLGTVPRLESLSVTDWPVEEVDDMLPVGALPALRSICGSVFMALALLPARNTVTSVKIRSDYVWTPLFDALADKNILDLEIPFENSTIEGICAACPNVETLRFSEVVTEDLERWLDGRFPDGFHKLKNMRTLVLDFELIKNYDFIVPGSAAALRAVLQPIWPRLESIFFFRSMAFYDEAFIDTA